MRKFIKNILQSVAAAYIYGILSFIPACNSQTISNKFRQSFAEDSPMLNYIANPLVIKVILFAICFAFVLYAIRLSIKKRGKNNGDKVTSNILLIIGKYYTEIEQNLYTLPKKVKNQYYRESTIEQLSAMLRDALETTIEDIVLQTLLRDFQQMFSAILSYAEDLRVYNSSDRESYDILFVKLKNYKDEIVNHFS